MNVFELLLVGHLVADWVLQNDWMALGKRHAFFALAGLLHYAIYTGVMLLILWWVSVEPFQFSSWLVIGIFLFLSHWLVDGTELVQWWMCSFGQRNQTMVRIMVDQSFHLVVLAGIAIWWSERIHV